jgi:hypothetical protein
VSSAQRTSRPVCLDFSPQARRAKDCLGEAAASPVPCLDFSAHKCGVRFFVSLEAARSWFLFNRVPFFCCASSSRLSSLGARRQVLSHHHCRASVLEFGQQFSSPSTGTPCNEFQIPLDFHFQSILTEHAGRPYHIASVLGLRQMHSSRHRRHALQGLSFLAAAVVSVFLTIFRFARAAGSVTHRR